MRAVVVREFGGPEALQVIDVAVPEPGPGQLRIRVDAAAVNPVDVATRAGFLVQGGLMLPQDVIGIGWDVAGTVDVLGPGVTGLEPGTAVIGLRDRLELPVGTQAEYIVLDAEAVAPAPAKVSAVEASTLPLNGLTASQALDILGLTAGQTLLVTGAAGAVGGFAVQLAALAGIDVVATASAADEEQVRAAGARWFVSRDEPLADRVRELVPGGVDGALDAAIVGLPALAAVGNNGAFVAVVVGAEPLPLRGIRVSGVWVAANRTQLGRLARLVDAGQLTLRVAGTLPLDEVAKAHQQLAEGGLRGRLVLTP